MISCRRDGEGPLSAGPVDVGAFETVLVRLTLLSSGARKELVIVSLSRDPGSPASATTIDTDQMRLLPSGGSIWSLIENQDMSATTDRIDVGGMRSDLPALFSARGGTSWTQNEYRLNGMSVTDPYDGGLPFYVPDLFSFRTVRLENAGHPAGFSPRAGPSISSRRGAGTRSKARSPYSPETGGSSARTSRPLSKKRASSKPIRSRALRTSISIFRGRSSPGSSSSSRPFRRSGSSGTRPSSRRTTGGT